MSYSLKIEDFIQVEENKSSFDLNDMVAICKRHNNPKRDYLFVNKYQAKHYPVAGDQVLQLFSQLYQEICRQIDDGRSLLVIGFAETATAIAQSVMHMALEDGRLNPVFYLQTTRETFQTQIQNIAFEEEHSHASTQKLFYRPDIPAYDTVLFIEDEITTGNTIINFIEKFKEIQPQTSFAVASILNWQNQAARDLFQAKDIQRIYLVSGQMKESVPPITLEQKEIERPSLDEQEHYFLSDQLNPRTGLTRSEFTAFEREGLKRLKSQLPLLKEDSQTAIIGTEENMWLPILLAAHLGAEVRSTTRSPIAVSDQEGYLLHNGLALASAYESQRLTFLYNIDTCYYQIIIVYEEMTAACRNRLETHFQAYSQQPLVFIKQ